MNPARGHCGASRVREGVWVSGRGERYSSRSPMNAMVERSRTSADVRGTRELRSRCASSHRATASRTYRPFMWRIAFELTERRQIVRSRECTGLTRFVFGRDDSLLVSHERRGKRQQRCATGTYGGFSAGTRIGQSGRRGTRKGLVHELP